MGERVAARRRHVGRLRQRVRFAIENVLGRSDLVFSATPQSFARANVPAGPDLQLHIVTDVAGFAPFAAGFELEYYRGYAKTWCAPLARGEQAAVGTINGRVASIAWLQLGTKAGYPTYYDSRMFEHEARILRVGVVPSFRRQRVNVAAMHGLLQRLFAAGMQRVFVECRKTNVPSLRTFVRVGFAPVGILRVVDVLGIRRLARWTNAESAMAEFRSMGIARQPWASPLATPELPP
jgi:ribosomal protein S18 acetylase RimI-like enzyme